MDPSPPDQLVYRSYLLRLWQDAATRRWHGSLQSTATQQTMHFATVEALLGFLLAEPAMPDDTATSVLQPP